MGPKSDVRPAFSAGPLLMPPIRLECISGQAAATSLSKRFPQPSFAPPTGRTRFSFWPCLCHFGSRCLYGARVMPLTLTNIIREDRSGSPAMHRDELGHWIPGTRRPPLSAGAEAVMRPAGRPAPRNIAA
jgi:hypothetical protein